MYNVIYFDNTVCGCGDDLNAGHDPNHLQTSENTMNTEAIREDNRYLNFGRTFYNIGYRRRGTFRDLDILAVHPAGACDLRFANECVHHFGVFGSGVACKSSLVKAGL